MGKGPTQAQASSYSLIDQPTASPLEWLGYYHNTDATVLPPNCLTFPSINCFIPQRDKIVPRLGKTILGQRFTTNKNWPIIGHKERFTTMGGYTVEVRVTQSDDSNIKDLIEVLFNNPLTGIPTWYPITLGLHSNTNPLLKGVHRYYMDDWFDTNLNPALSLNVPRLIWTNGNAQIYSWIGAIAPIVYVSTTSLTVDFGTIDFINPSGAFTDGETITGGTSSKSGKYIAASSSTGIAKILNPTGAFTIGETITGGTSGKTATVTAYIAPITWASLGFIDPAITGETAKIIINGIEYTATSGWNTSTLVVSSASPAIAVGDVAFSEIRADNETIPFDVCKNNKNYMFYGNWNSRRLFMSNNFNHDATQDITNAQAVQNDMIVSGSYTGTGSHVLRYQIDSVSDAPTTYYYDLASPASYPIPGLVYFSGIRTSVTPRTYNVGIDSDTDYFTWTYTSGNTLFSGGTVRIIAGPILLNSGVYINFTANTSVYAYGQHWTYNIGPADTYSIYLDGVLVGSAGRVANVTYTTDGVNMKVNAFRGHAIGDYWEVTLNQSAIGAWHNFNYTLPVRKPGEGYIYQLPSNFWAMAPQEEEMYINTQYGSWSIIATTLSADLQSEAVSLQPIKQSAISKVLYPYMITHLDNDLIFVTTNKTLDMIGRREYLELPQIGYLSQPVDIDFKNAIFTDGSMKYWDKKLWITSPKESTMFVYDNQAGNKYWQPPQVIAENGILSIIENTLISHSNIRNQTFQLFTGESDDGGAYTVRARTPYNSYGNRWGKKNSNKSFFEGYVSGAPKMIFTVYQGVKGCKGIFSHPVEPIICIAPTRAPLGEGNLGSHPFGSDMYENDLSHFNEIYTKFNPILEYYFAALEAECTSTNHTYIWLSMALNEIPSNRNNLELINEEIISRE